MDKKEMSTYPNFTTFGDTDKVFGYSSTGGFGYYPASMINRKGYACRRWNISNGTPVGEAYGNIDYLRDLPGLLGLGCYLVSANRERRKLNPANHYQFADGTAALLDGTMGDYMWCWNAHYYAWWIEGGYYYEAVSLNPIIGKYNYRIPEGGTSALGIGVVDRTNNKLVSVINSTAQYRGGNNDAAKDGTYRTLLGRGASSLSSIDFGTLARAKGEGWEAYWYTHSAVIGYLTRIILGTRNIQTAYNASKDANGLYQGGLGAGVSSFGQWGTWENFPFIPTSVGVDLGDACGVSNYAVTDAGGATVYTAPVPCFFGLKNFFGHISRWSRGDLVNKLANGSGDVYVATSLYAAFNAGTVAGLLKAATVPQLATAGWSYIMTLSMQNLCHLPTLAGASDSTYYCDGFYNDNAASGLRCPRRGGDADHGGLDGCECVYVDGAPSGANANVSSPLCYSKEDVSPVPTLML
jgi:hypothetical protein